MRSSSLRPKILGLMTVVAALTAVFVFAGTSAATTGGSLDWNKINGATACAPDTTGTMLWIFNPHSDATPTDLTITWNLSGGGTFTHTYTGWTPSGGGQNWHLTVDIPDGAVLPPASATLDYTGSLGDNPILTISGCNEGTTPSASNPTVVKDAAGSYNNTYTWDISKDVDKTYVEQVGGTVTFNYTVTVSHDSGTISDVAVSGTITAVNGNGGTVTLSSVTDELSDNTSCTVDDSGGYVIPANGTLDFPYSCDLGTTLPTGDLFNTATIGWDGQTVDGKPLAAGTATYTTPTAISFTGTDIDECIDVTDTNVVGSLGTVCVGDANPTTFTYSKAFAAPTTLGSCLSYDNTATFVANDTGATDSAGQTVQICAFNKPLTIGYWKTHMYQCPKGTKTGTNGCNTNGPFTATYLGRSICNGCATVGILGSYNATSQANALAVFNANNCSSSMTDANAAACLAAQLLAAELNVANVANPCICDTIKLANQALAGVNYQGPGKSVTLTPTYTRAYLISLKTALDNYNNGLGCP